MQQAFADDYGSGLRINHQDKLSGRTTCVPTMLSMQNGQIRIHLNGRTALTQRREQLESALGKRLNRLGMAFENVRWIPPRYTPPNEPPVPLLLDTCCQFLQPRLKPYVMGGATHSRVFPRSLPYGPEVLDPRVKHLFGKAHEADEAVCVDELLQAMKIYVIALTRLDAAPASR